MNYRHVYHAGNFADVFKHAALTLLLEHLRQKEKPFAVIDTHAGVGLYDLAGPEAAKTGEAEAGITALLAGGVPDGLPPSYAAILADLNPSWPGIRFYPGSPLIVKALLRPQDRLAAVELHPEDVESLRAVLGKDPRIQIRHANGYAALKALLPPPERRGLVLIDPPFEAEDEFKTAAHALAEGLRRWETGIFALWYPVKEQGASERFLGEATHLPRPSFAAEFHLRPPGESERMQGCGLFVVNPPWRFDEEMAALLTVLSKRLRTNGPTGLRWIKKAT